MPLRMIRVEHRPDGRPVKMHWSGIFSGAFTTLGLGFMFLLLGNAIGLSIHNTITPGLGTALRFWSCVYIGVTLIFSYYLGGLASTRSNEILNRGEGALHGVVSWGLATTLAAYITVGFSPASRLLLEGTGTDSGNWLAFFVVVVGLMLSAFGGLIGKKGVKYTRIEDEQPFEERGVG